MIRVTLEFNTIEETIVALGKMSALGKARRAANTPSAGATQGAEIQAPEVGNEPTVPASAPATRTRKPRNDAGKPRGPYKKDAKEGDDAARVATDALAPSEAPAPSTPPAEMESPAPSVGKDHEPQAAVPKQPVPSAEAAQKALERLFEAAPPKGGIEAARSTLAKFSVTRLRDLPMNSRAEFIAVVDKALA